MWWPPVLTRRFIKRPFGRNSKFLDDCSPASSKFWYNCSPASSKLEDHCPTTGSESRGLCTVIAEQNDKQRKHSLNEIQWVVDLAKISYTLSRPKTLVGSTHVGNPTRVTKTSLRTGNGYNTWRTHYKQYDPYIGCHVPNNYQG